MGNTDKQWCVIVFCDQWGNTLRAATLLPCEQRPFDLPLPNLSRKIEGPLLAGYYITYIQWNIDVYISVISVNNDAIYVCIKPHVRLKMSHIFSIINFVELLFEKFPLCIASETFEYSQARKLSFSDEIKKKSLGFLHNQSLTVCRNPYSILFRFFCFRLICKTIAALDKTQTRKHVKVI